MTLDRDLDLDLALALALPFRGMYQSTVYYNLPYSQVFEHETKNKEGESTANGTFCVSTGQFTGRSPKDKYFVKQVRTQSLSVVQQSTAGYGLSIQK